MINRKRLREIGLTPLKKRGWTQKMIRQYLGPADREWTSPPTVYEYSKYSYSVHVGWGMQPVVPQTYSTRETPGKHFQRWNLDRVLEIENLPEVATILIMKKLGK